MRTARHRRRSLRSITLAGCLAACAVTPSVQAASLTYDDALKSTDLQRFTRWVGALARHVADMQSAPARCNAGDQAYCFVVNYDDYLISLSGLPASSQIDAVNRFVNQAEYVEDTQNYGVSDYWASPLELFRRGGDCEDFAIAKYVAFRRLGYSEDQLRVWVVHDERRNVDHAVMTVAVGAETFVLDSLTNTIMEAGDVDRYAPIYSINASAWWLHDDDLSNTAIRTGAN